MPNRPCQLALNILCRVESGAYADRLLEAHRHTLNKADGHLLQNLVLGTLTYQARLDYLLTPYLKKPIHKQRSKLRNILRLGVYQLTYLDRVPSYAVVSESVTLARNILGTPTSKMVNAILRGVSENRKPIAFPDSQTDPVKHLSVTTSHPIWLITRWLQRYGFDETQALCNANNTQPALTIRPNTLRTTADTLHKQLADEDIEAQPSEPNLLTVYKVNHLFKTKAYHNGLFTVQGPGAARVIQLLDPQPGETILDMCSAPGGKTTAIAEYTQDQSFIVATDLYLGRLKTLAQNIHRLGLTSIHSLALDAQHLPFSNTFDRVLLDAPCSALGILSHHPDLRWRRQETDIHDLASLQRTLLDNAAQAVRSGGVLVYSTCTLEPEENGHLITAFLADNPNFSRHQASHEDYDLQLLPHQTGNDGVFAVCLQRIS